MGPLRVRLRPPRVRLGPLRAELGCLEVQVETSEGKISLIGALRVEGASFIWLSEKLSAGL